MKRRFARVPKTKGGVPKKYVTGSKNKKKTEEEIKRTRKKYREGKLTKKEMQATYNNSFKEKMETVE